MIGYKSDFPTFKGLLDYQRKLEGFNAPVLSSASSIDVSSRYHAPERSRRHSDGDTFLERALAKARATLNGPKPPKPWLPTFEQLQISARAKDEKIEQRLRPKRKPLPASLSSQDNARVDSLLKTRGVIAKHAREQVCDKDLTRLRPSQWLNDEIMNFYGSMIMSRSEGGKENPAAKNGATQGKPLNAHYFSTFFWSKLTGEGYEKGRLAKWTKKVDIFTKDVILIPVNHNNAHWTAAAINFRKKRIESYDSMNMDRQSVFKRLRGYLDAEHRNKKKLPFDFTGWQDYLLEGTPQQENCFDCGVFTCQFLEHISRGEESFNFTQGDMPYLRRRMIWEIGNTTFMDS
ncbi:cysteine proteinase [Athelia psychrophila]|uniref:Cysteine proteinase n=1 Tax=Athelia psychrophila TaxID=1759441 RepID=A0A166V051_9AGAM|nr:cysteine proteinase [Fibularhizoctonia sp. CBS 109695]